MSEKLLPCPLCGPGQVSLNPPSETYRYGSINCPGCMLTLPGEIKDQREMIEVWNTRPDHAPSSTSPSPALPAAWIDFADNGNIRFWTNYKERAEQEKERGRHLRMFTLGELVALAAKAQPSTASTDKPAAIEYRGIALAAHNRATPVAPDASTPVQRPHE